MAMGQVTGNKTVYSKQSIAPSSRKAIWPGLDEMELGSMESASLDAWLKTQCEVTHVFHNSCACVCEQSSQCVEPCSLFLFFVCVLFLARDLGM